MDTPGFLAAPKRSLRRLGLVGDWVAAVLDGSGIRLSGAAGGAMLVPLSDLRAIRVGATDGRGGPFHQILLLRRDGTTLQLEPIGASRPWPQGGGAYARCVRAIARALADAGRIEAIETGSTKGWALFGTVLLALLPILSLALFAFVLREDERALMAPRWIVALVPASMTALFAALVLWWIRRHWPRRVGALADLDRILGRERG